MADITNLNYTIKLSLFYNTVCTEVLAFRAKKHTFD